MHLSTSTSNVIYIKEGKNEDKRSSGIKYLIVLDILMISAVADKWHIMWVKNEQK